jgi:hypothetical protein
VVTVTTKIQRIHPEVPRPQRNGHSVIATVPNGVVAPTPEEEERGQFYRDGNMYVALDVPEGTEAPPVVGITLGNRSTQSQAISSLSLTRPALHDDGGEDALADTSSLSSEWDASSLSDTMQLTEPGSDITTTGESGIGNAATPIATILSAVSSSAPVTNVDTAPPPVPTLPTIPAPNTIEPPTEVPEGTRFYVVYVGREVGIYWGDWYVRTALFLVYSDISHRYEVCDHLVKGVSGHRATKHSTFSQALVEYTRAYYNQKPGYSLRIATEPLPTATAHV